MATAKKADDVKKLAKATPADTVAKVEAAKKAAAKEAEVKATAAPKAEVKKAAAPKAETKKEAAPKAAAKKAAAPKAETKKAAAPKAEAKTAAKKPAAKKAAVKTDESVFIEFAGGQIEVSALVAKAKDSIGKKAVKELNVYYQPETGMVYYTADGEEGSYKL